MIFVSQFGKLRVGLWSVIHCILSRLCKIASFPSWNTGLSRKTEVIIIERQLNHPTQRRLEMIATITLTLLAAGLVSFLRAPMAPHPVMHHRRTFR